MGCQYEEVNTCLPCPENAECYGGATLVPMAGTWHSAANSTFMNGCPNPEACRDGDEEAQVRGWGGGAAAGA